MKFGQALLSHPDTIPQTFATALSALLQDEMQLNTALAKSMIQAKVPSQFANVTDFVLHLSALPWEQVCLGVINTSWPSKSNDQEFKRWYYQMPIY